MEADEDGDGKLSFEEFARTVANTVCEFVLSYFSLCLYLGGWGVFWTKSTSLSLPRHARVHRAVFAYSIFITGVHVNLLRFPGYCKANDARRLILDVANAPAGRLHISIDPTILQTIVLHTYPMALLVTLTIIRLTMLSTLSRHQPYLASLFHS